jgi:hypothetical protein
MGQWTLEQLKHLRDLEAQVSPVAKISVLPISKGGLDEGYGTAIVWDARLYRRGVMGPRSVTFEELVAADVPEAEAQRWVAQTGKAVATLNRLYPVLVPAIEARVKAIEAAVPAALPVGE